jgi:hemoglobin-like flavoprotein
MLNFVVKSLDWPATAWRDEVSEDDDLFLVVLALGRRHSELYRVPDASYEAVGAALLWTLDYGLGKKFDEPCRAAWTRLYGLIATAMKMGRLSVRDSARTDASLDSIVSARARAHNHPGGVS